MTSEPDAYAWAWLPGAVDPVVVGALQQSGRTLDGEPVLLFRYGRSYLDRPDAISLFPPELPLGDRVLDPTRPSPGRTPLPLAGVLRDAAPDAWGRRVIDRALGGGDAPDGELRYLLRCTSRPRPTRSDPPRRTRPRSTSCCMSPS
jgi:serine/threonine-protein kinase HipA